MCRCPVRFWPGPGFGKGGGKATLADSTNMLKVSLHVQFRTHTVGQERLFNATSKDESLVAYPVREAHNFVLALLWLAAESD